MNEALLNHFKRIQKAGESGDTKEYLSAVESFRAFVHTCVTKDLREVLEELANTEDEDSLTDEEMQQYLFKE